jgi:hypothetical protein
MAIRNDLWASGKFYGYLVYFVVSFPVLGYFKRKIWQPWSTALATIDNKVKFSPDFFFDAATPTKNSSCYFRSKSLTKFFSKK